MAIISPSTCIQYYQTIYIHTGADPGFQVRVWGGGALKKIVPIGERREMFWGYFV